MAVASEPGSLLFIVDDAHWLDRSSARILAFMARRLAAEPVGVLFATRDPRGYKREQSQRSLAIHSERRRRSRPGAAPSHRGPNPPPESAPADVVAWTSGWHHEIKSSGVAAVPRRTLTRRTIVPLDEASAGIPDADE